MDRTRPSGNLNTGHHVPSHIRHVRVGDRVIILDIRSESYFALDPVASLMWEELIAGRGRDECLRRLGEEISGTPQEIEDDLYAFSEKCLARGLMRESPEAPAGEEYSLTLIALDDEKIEQAKRILVALGPISLPRETEFLGAVEMEAPYLPTGEKETLHYYAGGIGVVPETDPVVKPSSGRVSLVHSRPMNGWLLDWTGKRAMPLETEYQDGQVHFTIQPQDKVLWYMLETE